MFNFQQTIATSFCVVTAISLYSFYKRYKSDFIKNKSFNNNTNNDLEIVEVVDYNRRDLSLDPQFKKVIYNVLLNLLDDNHNNNHHDFLDGVDLNIPKIWVKYKLNNVYYLIVIDNLFELSKNNDYVVVNHVPKMILGAELNLNHNKFDYTEHIKQFAGPRHNFYKDINGVSRNLHDLLFYHNHDTRSGSGSHNHTLTIHDIYLDSHTFEGYHNLDF